MGPEDRIATLEAAVMTLARQTAENAAIATAQGIIIRALGEVLAHSTSTSVGDVHDLARAMTAEMPEQIGAAVRAMLAETYVASGARH